MLAPYDGAGKDLVALLRVMCGMVTGSVFKWAFIQGGDPPNGSRPAAVPPKSQQAGPLRVLPEAALHVCHVSVRSCCLYQLTRVLSLCCDTVVPPARPYLSAPASYVCLLAHFFVPLLDAEVFALNSSCLCSVLPTSWWLHGSVVLPFANACCVFVVPRFRGLGPFDRCFWGFVIRGCLMLLPCHIPSFF